MSIEIYIIYFLRVPHKVGGFSSCVFESQVLMLSIIRIPSSIPTAQSSGLRWAVEQFFNPATGGQGYRMVRGVYR